MGIFLTSGKGRRTLTPQPSLLPETPINIEMTLPPVTELQLGGSDVNLVLMVKEHAPTRIAAIDKELNEMQLRTIRLNVEREKLERLIKAVED